MSVLDDNMMPIPNNTDVVCYYVTKHSWRGKYVTLILGNVLILLKMNLFLDIKEYLVLVLTVLQHTTQIVWK